MRFVSVLLILCIFSQSLFADDCDWTKIVKNADGTFTYPKALHLCVGKMVQDNKAKTQQVGDLTQALSMKDLALQASDKRVQNWSTTASGLEDRLQKVDSLEKHNEFIYFGAGVLSAVLVGLMTARLIGR
jgi:hypothetical protein